VKMTRRTQEGKKNRPEPPEPPTQQRKVMPKEPNKLKKTRIKNLWTRMNELVLRV